MIYENRWANPIVKTSDCEIIGHIEVEETYKHENASLDTVREIESFLDEEGQELQYVLTKDLHVIALDEYEDEYTANIPPDFEHTPTLENFENEFKQSKHLLSDLELIDINTVLDKKGNALLHVQVGKSEAALRPGRGQAPGWQGAVSLIYVNWEHEEEAIQEALNRLGYAELVISETTRAFILQAARVGGLPYQQELQLTTQLATARAQLAQIPSCDDPGNDAYALTRNILKDSITELEQILIYKMQWVAIKKAPQFLGNNIELDDLIQYGMLGVIAGIKHFDSSRQSKLLSVVNIWVFQSIRRAIHDYGHLIRIPTHVCEQLDTIRRQHLQLQMTLGRLPSHGELANAIKIPIDRLEILLNDSKEYLSLDSYHRTEYANDGYSFQMIDDINRISQDTMKGEEDEIGTKQIIEDLLSCLSTRERQVIYLRFGLDGDRESHTLGEVGNVLHVTRERVRQIERRALKKMKKAYARYKW